MSTQDDPGQGVWWESTGSPQGQPDPWTSELWARPDTVGGLAQTTDRSIPAPPPPPHGPQRPSRRGLAVVAAVVAAALLAGGAALTGALRSTDDPAAAAPRPSVSAPPSVPSSPSRPTVPPSTPPSTAPSAPPGVVPSTPPSGGQQPGSSLTPDQSADAAAVSKGLVDVNTTIGFDGAQGAGTGIVLSADGLVLTNHHVVAGATAIRVTDVGNGKAYDATVLGYDSTHDVAVLRLKDASGLTVAPLGSSSTVKVGDAVVAVGNAGGVGGTPTPVAGTVRALDQQITVRDELDGSAHRLTGLIQVDAAIAPGDSGGAVVNSDGKVVGVVTAGSTGGASASDSATLVDGFAIPIDQARSIAEQIIDGRSSSTVHIGGTAFLGVQVAPGTPTQGAARAGAQVAGVVPGSAAKRAGIEQGDVLTAVDGRAVTSPEALHTAVSAHRPGDTVKVAWTDASGKTHSATVRLGSGPVG